MCILLCFPRIILKLSAAENISEPCLNSTTSTYCSKTTGIAQQEGVPVNASNYIRCYQALAANSLFLKGKHLLLKSSLECSSVENYSIQGSKFQLNTQLSFSLRVKNVKREIQECPFGRAFCAEPAVFAAQRQVRACGSVAVWLLTEPCVFSRCQCAWVTRLARTAA